MRVRPKLTNKQEIAFAYLKDNETTEILFGGGAGGGKSWFLCAVLISQCLKYKGIRCLLGRAKLDTLKKTTLNTFFEVCEQWNLTTPKHYAYNAQTNIISFYNGSEIYLKDLFQYPSDRNFDSLGSLELTIAAIDECNQITEKAKQIVSSRIRYKLDKYDLIPKLLLTCNPSKNWTYSDFYRMAKNKELPKHRKFVKALVDDNENISKHYKEQLGKLDKLSKERLLYGNWEYDDNDDSLILYDKIIDLFTNEVQLGEKYITCDVARFGQDRTVIMVWNGLQVIEIKVFAKSSVTEVAKAIEDLQFKHEVKRTNITIDEDGVGGGVVDMLPSCRGFVNNSRALNSENFRNLKTQCYYKLSEKINKNEIGITTNDIMIKQYIIEELENVRSKDHDKDTKLSIISKDVIKSLIGRSPDFADSLAMRMYHEVQKNYGRYFVQ
jgi:phage terminase large subunit